MPTQSKTIAAAAVLAACLLASVSAFEGMSQFALAPDAGAVARFSEAIKAPGTVVNGGARVLGSDSSEDNSSSDDSESDAGGDRHGLRRRPSPSPSPSCAICAQEDVVVTRACPESHA